MRIYSYTGHTQRVVQSIVRNNLLLWSQAQVKAQLYEPQVQQFEVHQVEVYLW
jgi:hypothetical protein